MLSADHWLEMFRLLQLPKGTTIEKLKFGDLLLVGHSITANVDQLKALNARAQVMRVVMQFITHELNQMYEYVSSKM